MYILEAQYALKQEMVLRDILDNKKDKAKVFEEYRVSSWLSEKIDNLLR
jgi:hypothetical protein